MEGKLTKGCCFEIPSCVIELYGNLCWMLLDESYNKKRKKDEQSSLMTEAFQMLGKYEKTMRDYGFYTQHVTYAIKFTGVLLDRNKENICNSL